MLLTSALASFVGPKAGTKGQISLQSPIQIKKYRNAFLEQRETPKIYNKRAGYQYMAIREGGS